MPKVSTPVASPNGGTFTTSPQTVTLTCATVGAAIYYTTDGTTPTAGSPVYSTPLSISVPSTLKAIGILSGDTNSNVRTSTFAIGYTISGSLGTSGAGATVFFTEQASGNYNQQGTPPIADSNGNFTSAALPPNATYKVIPVLYGAEFSPFSQTVNLVTSNIAGINWTGSPSAYHLVQGFSDTFNRANVNPLDNGWSTPAVGASALQIVSDGCECTVASSTVCSAYPSYTPPADCYVSLAIKVSLNHSQAFIILGRQNTDLDSGTVGYQLEGSGGAGTVNDGAFQIAGIAEDSGLFSTPGFADNQTPIYTIQLGDVFTLVLRGNNQYMFQNSTPLGASTSSLSPNADLCGVLLTCTTLSDIAINNFVAGSVAAGSGSNYYSQPDCRVAPFGPNGSVNVNGTLTYTLQTSDNSAVPSVDSRILKPVASGAYPQNNRTPGTYGPGE